MINAAYAGPIPQRNTLGIVGFVFSLLGLATCGLIAPVGLLLSLLALFSRPRSFATAGVVIGGFGTLWLGLLGAGMLASFTSLQPVVKQMSRDFQQLQVTLSAATAASHEITRARERDGGWPDQAAGQELVGRHIDAFGTPLRYTRVGELVLIVSAGADREFATPDDVSIDPATMKSNLPEDETESLLDD